MAEFQAYFNIEPRETITADFDFAEKETIDADFVIYAQTATVAWGGITGTLSNQADLQNALDNKYDASNPNKYIPLTALSSNATGLSYSNTTGVFSLASGYEIPLSSTLATFITKDVNNLTNYMLTSDINTALSGKQDTISDLDTIRSNASAGKSASDTISSYGNIVTHNTSEFATSAQGTKADSALQGTDVINNVTSTTTDKPLSANMGKELQDEIDNLKSRGRFLALWNCTTGLAETQPTTLPYDYKTGDYFIIGTVGETNYKPSGSQYTGTASTVIETSTVSADDVYYYDGNVWHLQINTQKTVTFANIAGQPTDNSNLASALNSKQDELTAGDNIQITNNVISATDTTYTAGTGIDITNNVISNTQTSAEWGNITGTLSNQTDLQNALNAKQDTLTAGSNIQITNNVISATDTTYTAGTGIDIDIENANAIDILQEDKRDSSAAYTIVGNLTESPLASGAYTGFSNSSDYIIAPLNDFPIGPTDEAEFVVKMRTGTSLMNGATIQRVRSYPYPQTVVYSSQIRVAPIGYTSGSLYIYNLSLTASTDYWIRSRKTVSSSGCACVADYSTDGVNWLGEVSTTFSTPSTDWAIPEGLCYLGGGMGSSISAQSGAVLYMEDCYLKINGTTVWSGKGTITKAVARATNDLYGLVKPDGSTITVSDGIITASTLSGLTATVGELNYCDGVTSSIQTQLNGKQAQATYDATNERLVL